MRRLTLALALAAAPAAAQEGPYVEFRALTPELAMQAAVAALESCRAGGYQVGVAVVDRMGVTQVFVRDRFAGPHVEETALRKAWTAVSFRTDTLALDAQTQPGSISAGIRDISRPLPLGGGVPVNAGDGDLVAGIGVSGAPGPDIDDQCARAGIAEIEDEIAF
ncbi:MAG: heme-binding protein [Paracoccaceae bacterium]|nr:heme-binding protein [Paracoccaceae bacterium]